MVGNKYNFCINIIYMTKNAYIHIPFCKSRCKYCSFVSDTRTELKSKYIETLIKEIQLKYKSEKLETLYFGGGTPSLLTSTEFDRIIKLFNFEPYAEITAELNPETISAEYLENLKDAGINRLSFGCQTFNNNILKKIGRRHNCTDVKNSIKFAKECGFKNISLDLIYGLPNQTLDEFKKDLLQAVDLDIEHISLYGLKIDEGCYFYKNPPLNIPDNDTQADMYLIAIKILENFGFFHYEISNFSKTNMESRHNLNYWNNNTYYGFGAGAHGYENGIRYNNTENISEYIKNPNSQTHFHKLSKQEQLEEEIFLGFRKSEGINILTIEKNFDINFDKKYNYILKKYSDYIEKTKLGYRLNNNGFLISNNILSEFLE